MNAKEPKRYRVVVRDNFHYMDESESRRGAQFDTIDGAVGECMRIVDDCLRHLVRPGMSANDLYDHYKSFGDDPYIIGGDEGAVPFSAWTYARARVVALCAGG